MGPQGGELESLEAGRGPGVCFSLLRVVRDLWINEVWNSDGTRWGVGGCGSDRLLGATNGVSAEAPEGWAGWGGVRKRNPAPAL